jgi:uncharacterized membrane protein
MAHADVILPTQSARELPAVRRLGLDDLKYALAKGVDDFKAMPTHVIFLSLLYPIAGLALWRAMFGYNVVPLLYPLAAGFALIGPFAAIGLYELSRRRELGLDTSWKHAFDIMHSPSLWSIAALGLLLMAIFGVWLAVANGIYVSYFGYRQPTSLAEFSHMVFGTPEGHQMILVGNAVGFAFAALVFALSAVSFPLLLDRNVGAHVAIATSIAVILKNPIVMALWGFIVAMGLLLGSLPLFFGLAIAMPILGHASWHLYRRAVEPDTSPRPEYQPKQRARRYAADFPTSLFVPITRKNVP